MSKWIPDAPPGSAAFRIGEVGLDRTALGAGGAHRSTELAISIAADRIYEELPEATETLEPRRGYHAQALLAQ